MNEREQYMLEALRVIAAHGKGHSAVAVLRPYMDGHTIKWNRDEDVKTWVRRIAQDAIKYAENYKEPPQDRP